MSPRLGPSQARISAERELTQRVERVVEGVVRANEGRWEKASARDRARVRMVARAVADRLLAEPMRRLGDPGWSGDRGEAAWLFALGEPEETVHEHGRAVAGAS